MQNLSTFFKNLDQKTEKASSRMPSKKAAECFLDGFFDLLFPLGNEKAEPSAIRAARLRADLESLIGAVLGDGKSAEAAARANLFFEKLPDLHDVLTEDAAALAAFDPAAESLEEVIAAYPGFFATAAHRAANALFQLEIPVLPRILAEIAHARTGIDMHPAARIGRRFCIDHGTGVVIGATAEIGDGCKIYQGVTLGALAVDKKWAETKRHPTLENDVIVYANATILGGKTRIGHGSVIGGNVFLTESVEPFSVVFSKNEVRIRAKEMREAINFII